MFPEYSVVGTFKTTTPSPPAPINSGGSSLQIPTKNDEGIWGKLQTLELHYT